MSNIEQLGAPMAENCLADMLFGVGDDVHTDTQPCSLIFRCRACIRYLLNPLHESGVCSQSISRTSMAMLCYFCYLTDRTDGSLIPLQQRIHIIQRSAVYLSSTDITFQTLSGILIKSAISLCMLGADLNMFIEGFAQLLVGAEVVVDPAII